MSCCDRLDQLLALPFGILEATIARRTSWYKAEPSSAGLVRRNLHLQNKPYTMLNIKEAHVNKWIVIKYRKWLQNNGISREWKQLESR